MPSFWQFSKSINSPKGKSLSYLVFVIPYRLINFDLHPRNETMKLSDYFKPLLDEKSRVGFRFTIFIQVLIVISIVSFTIETLPNLSSKVRKLLFVLECLLVGIFTCEYLIRTICSRPYRKYTLSFFGVVDLLAILPFYIAMGIDLRSLRIFRILRLFRILKLARYSHAIDHFRRALALSKEEVVVSFSAMLVLIYLSSVGIYYFENEAQPEAFTSIVDSLWWAVATLTTVGYGDVYPVTMGGRAFTFIILIVGLGIVALPAGIFAAALTKSFRDS